MGQEHGRRADLRYALHLMKGNRLVLVGLVLSVATLALALLSHLLVDPALANQQPLALRLCWNNPAINWGMTNIKTCPTGSPLGTDAFGRDLMQMIILAIPVDLQIAFEVVASAVAIGVFFGGLAAYAGGIVDEVILSITDIFLAIPAILLAIVLIVVMGRSLPTLTLAITITWWPYYVRLMRSQVITERRSPTSKGFGPWGPAARGYSTYTSSGTRSTRS